MSEADAVFCAEDVRARDFELYALTLFAMPEHRRALLALYAFTTEISRVRDMISQPLPGEIRLQWWTDAIAGKEHGEVGGNPVAAELLRAIEAYGLPVPTLDGMIDAHRFDLYEDHIPSLPEFERYALRTDSAVLSIAARILGANPAQTDMVARRAGIVLGMMRAIRLLPLHASRRQCYLPADLMERFGVAVEDVFAGKTTPELRALIDHVRDLARSHLYAALALVPAMPQPARTAFLQLTLLRRELDAGNPENPFQPSDRSRLRTLWTMWRAKT